MNFRDVELLSAYLDGQLSPSEASRLEARLSTDQDLKAALEDVRGTRGLLRRLPQRRAPRDFRLTAKMVGIKPPEPRAYPAFRLATALAAFLFVAAVALNGFVPLAASRMAPAAAPAPGYGMGGGGGGYGGAAESQPPAATEAPLLAGQSSLAPTATAEGTMSIMEATAVPQSEDTARAQATEAAGKLQAAQPAAAQQPAARQPVPLLLIVALGIVMLLCGAAAWMLRTNSDRRIRSRWNHK